MEPGPLVLRSFVGMTEHFARSGEVEPALRRQVLDRGQQVMRAVDVGVERGELVVERVADETLRRQVIALVGLDLGDHLVDAGVALERSGVQGDSGRERHAGEPVLGVLQRDAAHDAMNLVSLLEEQLRQIGTVLAGDSGDQSAFGHSNPILAGSRT